MKKQNQKNFYRGAYFLILFILWTVLLRFIDVKQSGPQNSKVGLTTINQFVHNLTGTNMTLYNITDWLGLAPIFFAMGFGVLGLLQWIKRKSLKKVDYSILVLGGFYIVVMAVYILFEYVVINYRPTLINGILEVSYPSSTTLLVMCVMPTAIMQLKDRLENGILKKCIIWVIVLFIIFMVAGRIISGVHWITDIIGGVLLSIGLVTIYQAVVNLKKN